MADFDAATIATTHGFCQEVLGGLGIAGDLEPDVTFVEDLGDLRRRGRRRPLRPRASTATATPPFDRGAGARRSRASPSAIPARRIVAAPAASVAERCAAGSRSPCATSSSAASGALAVMTYDDLLTRLATRSRGPAASGRRSACARAIEVVLVDEFQDTDPVQWEIMRRAFGDGGVTLVLIADPKQAIYAFRGADVYAYLEAPRDAAGARDARRSTGAATRR